MQNITVDDRVSRTQYQYTLEDPDANELNSWTDRFVAKLEQLPQLADVATDRHNIVHQRFQFFRRRPEISQSDVDIVVFG